MRLACFGGLGAEAINEGLNPGPLRRDFLVLRCLLGLPFGTNADKITKGSGVEGQLAAIEMRDGIDAAFQQAPVMADDDRRTAEALQPAFQPERRFEVEVVGRLVEQEQIGFQEQHPGQGDPHAPSAGELMRGSCLGCGIETQAGQYCRCSRRGAIGLDRAQPIMDLGRPVAL